MRVTRRFQALLAVGLVLAVLAVAFGRPLLLVGAAGVGGYLLARQYRFLGLIRRLDGDLAVEVSVPRTRVTEDEALPVTLRAIGPSTPLAVAVEASIPASADGPPAEERRLELDGDDPVSRTVEVSWPVVGTAAFDPATVTVTGDHGLFVESFERGSTPSITVEPRTPGTLHVGQGGDRIAGTLGEHATGELGEGIDPAELRQYVVGDAARDIDWKATARLNDLYVREHEVQTDRETVLVVDHREGLGTGQLGETELDYLREVALAFAEKASDLDDPLGLYTVGDGGLTTAREPSLDADHFDVVREALYDLVPTVHRTSTPDVARGPGAASRAGTVLASDGSAFATTLRPYFQDTDRYVQRIESDPLFATVETQLARRRGTLWTVLFTDDRDRTELRETVKLARRNGNHVVVFLTPDVLFEPGGLGDLEAAYERYADFERFRSDLEALDRVSTYEVGPGDRLGAILDARRSRRS